MRERSTDLKSPSATPPTLARPQHTRAYRGRRQKVAVSLRGAGRIKASFACVSPSAHGEIVVLESETPASDYLVGWRRDARHKLSILRISSASDRSTAVDTAKDLSHRYVPPVRRTRNKPRDYQRSIVYRWERAVCPDRGQLIDLDAARSLSGAVCARLGVKAIPVDFGTARLVASSYYSSATGIVLSSGMLDTATVLHEMAHAICDRMGVREVSHGPCFVATLLALNVLSGRCDADAGTASAALAGLDVNPHLFRGLLHLMGA